jgi:hypothetical protein
MRLGGYSLVNRQTRGLLRNDGEEHDKSDTTLLPAAGQ